MLFFQFQLVISQKQLAQTEDEHIIMQRTVVMYIEIGSFVSCLCGWILICSTMATEYWIVSESAEVVLNAGMYYSNLWMDCLADSTGVSDCRYFPSMMNLSVFLHVSRALSVVSVVLGFWGAVFALIGMKCTKIGCSEITNARFTFAAALTFMLSGFCGMIVYSWWGEKARAEFLDQFYLEIKYELGAALFIGWGGSCLVIGGSAVLCYFSGKESFPQRFNAKPRRAPTYMTARTRRSYMLPGFSRPTTVIVPSIYQSQAESRGSQLSTGRRETQESRSSRTIRSPPPPIDSAV